MSPQGRDHLAMKIGRAERHLREFDGLVVKYCTSPNPYEAQSRTENGRYVVTLTPRPFEGDVPLSLADMAYALRSGLDQLAWQLALLKTDSPSGDTMFPIFGVRNSRSEKQFQKRVANIPREAVDVIATLQPFHLAGRYMDHPLWQLNELSNMDKHRLPAVRCHDAEFNLEPANYRRRDTEFGIEFSWPLKSRPQVKIAARTPRVVFGDSISEKPSPHRPVFEIDRLQIGEIYRYVREDVAPKFDGFFR